MPKHDKNRDQFVVDIETSFGLTIIAKLGEAATSLIDLSGPYLWFKNSSNVQALFNIEALVSAKYDTKDVELFGLQNFGATFSIPGIVTVGPNFKIYGSVNFDLSLSGKFEAHVTIAEWDTQLAFPEAEDEAKPQATEDPGTTRTQVVGKHTVDWSINANEQTTAHVKPVASFGLEFDSKFISIDPATVKLLLPMAGPKLTHRRPIDLTTQTSAMEQMLARHCLLNSQYPNRLNGRCQSQ